MHNKMLKPFYTKKNKNLIKIYRNLCFVILIAVVVFVGKKHKFLNSL